MGNWDGGQLSTLSAGTTLSCDSLNRGQIYGIFFYNAAENDTSARVLVTWSNSTQNPPVPVTVPGTTLGQGLAAVALVSGNDTGSVSVSMSSDQGNAQVQCWIGSVGTPTNTTGINNSQMPLNGQPQPFSKYDRYFAVPPSEWCTLTINSPDITQFISLQFQENYATVYIVNPTQSGTDSHIFPITPSIIEGPVSKGTYSIVTPPASQPAQTLSVSLQGDGTQWVWMNADSPQDSSSATISLQPLS
jgi:hypothetical protein